MNRFERPAMTGQAERSSKSAKSSEAAECRYGNLEEDVCMYVCMYVCTRWRLHHRTKNGSMGKYAEESCCSLGESARRCLQNKSRRASQENLEEIRGDDDDNREWTHGAQA